MINVKFFVSKGIVFSFGECIGVKVILMFNLLR